MTATNSVVEGKMEHIAPAPDKQQLLVTGQYLYEQFVVAGEEQKSRMAIIRDLIDKGADPMQVKGATDEMVKLAKKKDEAAGVPEKTRGPKQATAMNVRTIFQQVYGALKFAPDALKDQGYTNDTGWLEARVMAKEALNKAGKVWSGHDVPTQAQKEQAALQRSRAGETEAMLQATKENPRQPNESLMGWNQRIGQAAEKLVVQAQAEKLADDAKKLYEYALKKYDRAVIAAAMILWHKNFQESNNGEPELSEEEANALLRTAQEEGGVEIQEGETQEA
jgi:hypothetical protein